MKLPRRGYTIGWAVIALAGAFWEYLAIRDKRKNDTLSEHIWWLFDLHPVIWWAALGAAMWAARHFWWKKR